MSPLRWVARPSWQRRGAVVRARLPSVAHWGRSAESNRRVPGPASRSHAVYAHQRFELGAAVDAVQPVAIGG
jgi:hypothetical protein